MDKTVEYCGKLTEFPSKETAPKKQNNAKNERKRNNRQALRADSKFNTYSIFFKGHYQDTYIDILSGRAMYYSKKKNRWIDIKEQVPILKSMADDLEDIKAGKIEDHLHRYGSEQPTRLLINVPEWDGRDRIKEIAQKIKLMNVSMTCLEQHLKQWGVGVFERVYNPFYQNYFIVFTGSQGVGKDTLIEILTAFFGQFRNTFTVMKNERDNLMQLADNLIINFPEFDRTGSMSVAEIKNMVTIPSADFRRPYERSIERHDFRCSFIGSCNEKHDVLRDTTGNRRFKLFDIESVDWSYPNDSAQIAAQWFVLYKQKYRMADDIRQEMQEYINQSSPESIEDAVCDLWDELLKSKIDLNPMLKNNHFFKQTEILDIFDTIKKTKGIRDRKLLSILKSRHRSTHTRTGKRYHLAPFMQSNN